jgi:adenylate cyclase
LQQLQADNIITITELGSDAETRIPPPPGVPGDRVGFNDIPIDLDGVVRRNLIFANIGDERFFSFSLRLAIRYLATQGIRPRNNPNTPDYLQLGDVTLTPLEPTSGAYQHADAGGYQVLLHYRSPETVARQVSFSDVLDGKIDPSWVKDKIVIIGTTAPSAKDLFYTPYSAAQQTDHQMPGVIMHTQMTSQILSGVLDGKLLFWFWSDGVEVLWVMGWAAVGGTIAWCLRHPVVLGSSTVGALLVLSGVTLWLFTQQGWVPLAAPAIALALTGGVVRAYRTYRDQRRQQQITQFWHEHSPTQQFDENR